MNAETRDCQNCKISFTIELEDFAFYEKMKVPPPTWCPECRLIRRLSFMNERTLYNRTCDLCHKKFVALFPQESSCTVYCAECWHSDQWDPMSYGMDVDFSWPFFSQLQELFKKVPQLGRHVTALENSDYANHCSYLKNCYLLFQSDYCERCMYGTFLEESKDSIDNYIAFSCERCYDSSNLYKDYNVRYSKRCNECMNVSFSYALQNCSDCFGCMNMKNKQYHIFNKPYSKEEYEVKMKEYDLGSYAAVQRIKKNMQEMMLRYPVRYVEGINNENVVGDYIFHSKNCLYCCEVLGGEDCKYCHFLSIAPTKDSYDFTMWGGGAERVYECMGVGGGVYDVKFCEGNWSKLLNTEYSREILKENSDCFGCIAVRKKQYCILNKQYTKKEYDELIPKIRQHMNDMPYVDSLGREYRYGEFFPTELSPYAYNETLAQAFFPLSKEEALKQGYQWREEAARNVKPTCTSNELPDRIKDIPDSIKDEVIECQHKGTCLEQCPGAFKITSQELTFYRQMNIPLPRTCHNCRHYSRFSARNPISRLWSRQCQCGGERSTNGVYTNTASHSHGASPCQTTFQTSYAPDRSDIVYCAECYQQEVV
jgi:hypothetical protein